MRPPFENTGEMQRLLLVTERLLGRYEGMHQPPAAPMLRRSARVRTVQASTQIEGNTLSEEQVTAILDGKRVVAPRRDILEVKNALDAYGHLGAWNPSSAGDLLKAHAVLMHGLVERPGQWRRGNVGIMKGRQIAHIAPPAARVPKLVENVLHWLEKDPAHAAVKAAVVHYELEFIHPFDDGNGRIGRLWHTLILSRFHPVFEHVPIESIIRDEQAEYYRVLRACDAAGSSTKFIEFSLRVMNVALEETLRALSNSVVTGEDRLGTAARHFGKNVFSRKEYRALFPTLSTATASRDLRRGVDEGLLAMKGEKALSRYRFQKYKRP